MSMLLGQEAMYICGLMGIRVWNTCVGRKKVLLWLMYITP